MKKIILFIFIILCAGTLLGMKRTRNYEDLTERIKIDEKYNFIFEHHCIESKFVTTAHQIYLFMLYNKKERDKKSNKYIVDAYTNFALIMRPYCELCDRLKMLFGNHEGEKILRSFIDRFIYLVAKNNLVALYFLDVLGGEFDFIDEEAFHLSHHKVSIETVKEKIKTYLL